MDKVVHTALESALPADIKVGQALARGWSHEHDARMSVIGERHLQQPYSHGTSARDSGNDRSHWRLAGQAKWKRRGTIGTVQLTDAAAGCE